MTVSVLILGIVSAVLVPMFATPSDVRLAGGTRKVLGDLQYAQSLAVATRAPVYVRCAANAYDVCGLSGSTLTVLPDPVTNLPFSVTFGGGTSAGSLKWVTLPAPKFGPANDATLGFDATGQPFAYNAALNAATAISTRSTIALASGTLQQAIYVEPLTGELHVP